MSRRKVNRDPRQGEVVDLSHDGRGVIRHEGKTVFVPDVLTGEVVSYRAMRANRRYDEGELLEVLQASEHRVEAKCAHFGVCGGCALQHVEPSFQLEQKQKHLADVFTRIGQVSPKAWLQALTGPLWGYRRRARLGVKYVHKKERVLVGFRERGKPYVADIVQCEVLDPRVGYKLEELAQLIQSMDARESIPQIEVSMGDDDVCLVFRHLQALSDDDVSKFKDYAEHSGMRIYLQSGGPDTVTPLMPDNPPLRYALPEYDVDLEFTPIDFVQVNAELNQKMIPHALKLLDIKPGERVLELFAGLGNFTLPLAREGAVVVAVEGDAGLVARGRANAQRQGLDAEYHVADLFEPQKGSPWLQAGFDKVLLDPPRAGAEQILPDILAVKPKTIVYVSCHPASLARDAAIIVAAGYRCSQAGVMDMFPHTGHVESIAVFHRP
ncbi:MAG: 23S rRNA (uracil(1939)-C(5))-methyltransferase RlmD [Oceanococcus sp.]